MSGTVLKASSQVDSAHQLAGAPLLRRLHRLLLSTFAGLVVYSILTTASKTGGVKDGSSYQLTLHPSPFVYIAVGLLVVWAIPAVLNWGTTEAAAVRIVDITAIIVLAILLGSMAIALPWFFAIPIDNGGHVSGPFPFPFGVVDYTFTAGD